MPNTLFHLQFPTPPGYNVFSWSTLLESYDCWNKQQSGTGAYSINESYLQVTTGLTAGGLARVWKAPSLSPYTPTWSKNRTIQFQAETTMMEDTLSENYASTGMGLPTSDGFGFRFRHDKIQGFASDGVAATHIDLITGLVPGTPYTHKYKAIFTPGTKVEFYIDDVLLGTITTNLPVTDSTPHITCRVAVKSGANVSSIIRISGFTFQQDQ